MNAPFYTPASNAGNLIASGTSLSAGKVFAALLDLTSDWEGQVTCKMLTGGSVSSTAGVKWDVFHIYAGTTLTAAASAGATSITVVDASRISLGQMIGLQQAGSATGEVVTVTAISGSTLTVSALAHAYSAGDLVYLIEQIPTVTVTPMAASGGISANTTYSKTLYLPQSRYLLRATNLDASNAVTIEATLDTLS